ncbi:WS/DGAT/MGAT family O-acyltransferase [Piscinibacterium candidicorallinum]|uniref:diacylglycerol O-acyltransferase n=1 Tax=Piscinibacterium candidicorallinum TaxID=1793872 RepID=A0ABV7H3Y6_9BURK
MGRERMSSVDTAWLRMDSPVNLMMIVGVHVFEDPIEYENLRKVVQARLLFYRRFKQKVQIDPNGAWWVDDEHFDLDQHVHRISLPGKGGKRELEKLVAALSTESLDFTRPLWQFHVVENYQGGNAVVVRIHHCIADGIALIGVLLSMTAPTAEESLAVPAAPSWIKTRSSADNANVWEDFFAPVTKVAARTLKMTGDLASTALGEANEVIQHPDVVAQRAVEVSSLLSHVARDAAQIALMADDTPTSLKGKPGRAKCVAWTEPLPLTEVKTVCKALGCSVNDVLLSCVAGAIRGYLLSVGDTIPCDAEIRAMVPVNLRSAGAEHKLGNKFGLVPLTLPVGIGNPLARLYEVRRRMNDLKGGYQAVIAMGVLGLVGTLPRQVQAAALSMFTNKATAVMTNVPGPSEQLYMAGAKMSQIMFWVPQSGDIGLGVSILSYGGGVQFGVITSKKLCPQPSEIIDRFGPEFERLIMTAMLVGPSLAVDPQAAEFELFPEIKVEFDRMQAEAAKAAAAERAAERARKAATATQVGKSAKRTKAGAADASSEGDDARASSPAKSASKPASVAADAPKKRSRFAQLRAET